MEVECTGVTRMWEEGVGEGAPPVHLWLGLSIPLRVGAEPIIYGPLMPFEALIDVADLLGEFLHVFPHALHLRL